MAVIELSYKDVIDAKHKADKAVKECDDYREKIAKKVLNKLGDSMTLGHSDHTLSAATYAETKIRELSSKAGAFEKYAAKLDNIIYSPENGAKAVDKQVEKMIKREYQVYKELNGIKVNPIYEGLCNLFFRFYNSNGFLKILKEAMLLDLSIRERIWDDLKYWYRCDGGKEIIKIVCGVVIAVAAVVAVIIAWPAIMFSGSIWATIVAAASLVGALIAAADAIINVIHEIKAFWNIRNNRPADALWDSNTNKLTDWLNRVVTDNKFINQSTTGAAITISAVELCCAIINLADLGVNGAKFAGGMQKSYQHGGWKTVWKNINKKTFAKFKDSNGKVTFKSVKSGFKATQKYLNRITMNRELRAYDRNMLETSKFYKQMKTFEKQIKPFKTMAKAVNKFVSKGVVKGSVSVVTEHVIDWTHAGKTIRSGIGSINGFDGAVDAFQQIQRNVVR